MGLIKSDVLKYLSDTRAHYAAYHNHKEVSAWAGVALYVLLIVQILFAKDEFLKSSGIIAGTSILIVILLVVMLLYLKTQFSLRREAANYVAALLYLSAHHLRSNENDIQQENFLIAVKTDSGHHSPQILPKIVQDMASEMDWVGHGARRRLEFVAFSIVLVISAAALLRLWSLCHLA